MIAGGASYAGSGVDIEAGDRAVALMRAAVTRTAGSEVVGGIGGFAGLYDASRLAGMPRPLLASATDGVGTKVVIARRTGSYGTIGIDLVVMVVDDLVVCGAEPLFMTDYIVCGKVAPERVAEIVGGIAEGCVRPAARRRRRDRGAPWPLRARRVRPGPRGDGSGRGGPAAGPSLVKAGDVVLAMASSGPHSNGYSLVRQILDDASLALEAEPAESSRPLGEELAEPTRIYARDCLSLAAACEVRAFAHIPGGGLAGNLERVLPPDADALLDRSTWAPPPVFGLLAGQGKVTAGPRWSGCSNGGRDDRRRCPATRWPQPSACWPSAEFPPGRSGRSSPAPAGPG